jgi:DmsE family decaheme c-type cytochrome
MRRLLFASAMVALLISVCKPHLVVEAAAQDKQQSSMSEKAGSGGKDLPVNPADYLGSETCTTCHAEESRKFDSNPHSKLALEHGGKGVTCESCHGPGKAHVESGGDKTKIFSPATATAKAVDTFCLSCHEGQHANFERSEHAKGKVSCVSCHSVHASQEPEHLLKVAQPLLCLQCHTDVKPQFSMPFHHRVEEGLMKCSDCHDPHGTFQGKQLRSTADQNAICAKCHAEVAGPFVYEHPVVKVEGCTSCHSPHGSPNPRLLNVSNVNTLCLQCHSATNAAAFPHAVSPTGPVHNQAAQYVACTNCHSQIHGSNASNIYFK